MASNFVQNLFSQQIGPKTALTDCCDCLVRFDFWCFSCDSKSLRVRPSFTSMAVWSRPSGSSPGPHAWGGSLLEAVTLSVHQLLDPPRERTAEAAHVQLGINIRAALAPVLTRPQWCGGRLALLPAYSYCLATSFAGGVISRVGSSEITPGCFPNSFAGGVISRVRSSEITPGCFPHSFAGGVISYPEIKIHYYKFRAPPPGS